MNTTEDTRGQSIWDTMPELPGQINISKTYYGQKRGFHLHKLKTDYWFVAIGLFMVVVMKSDVDGEPDLTTMSKIYLDQGSHFTIEPGTWHAIQALGVDYNVMVYYETLKSGPERFDDYERPLSLANKYWIQSDALSECCNAVISIDYDLGGIDKRCSQCRKYV